MTIVVGYNVDGVFRMAADTRWTLEGSTRIIEGSKLYRAGPWMFGESGSENALTCIRRRLALDKRIRNRDLGHLQDVIHATCKEYKEECWILTYHPDHGLNAVSEAGRVTPCVERYLSVGSGSGYVAAFINGMDWNAIEYGSHGKQVNLSDIDVEGAIHTAAWLDTTIGGYELLVYT